MCDEASTSISTVVLSLETHRNGPWACFYKKKRQLGCEIVFFFRNSPLQTSFDTSIARMYYGFYTGIRVIPQIFRANIYTGITANWPNVETARKNRDRKNATHEV